MMNPKEYRQPRCPHGWVDVTQCEPCKTAAERDALQNEIDHLRSALAQQGEPETAMIDAAMVEMANITPPLRRSECKRLIRAALSAAPASQKGEPLQST